MRRRSDKGEPMPNDDLRQVGIRQRAIHRRKAGSQRGRGKQRESQNP